MIIQPPTELISLAVLGAEPAFEGLWTFCSLASSALLLSLTTLVVHYRRRLRFGEEALQAAQVRLQSTTTQLEAALLQSLTIQEAERRALARELHDDMGQNLTAIKLLLQKAQIKECWDSVREASDVASDILRKVRQTSLNLRPAMLDDFGLLPTLEWHLKKFTKQTGIQVRFQHSPTLERLPPAIEIAAYRVVQEALNNIARHSGVSEARVEIRGTFGELWLKIEDHGRGFTATRHANETCGLAGMRERIELLRGEVQIESSIGAGTRITIRLPCEKIIQPQVYA